MFTLSGFADEISDQLDVQLEVLGQLDIRYLELRGVWGKNVLDLDDVELARIKDDLAAAGIGVSAIGSPIGKIDIDAPMAPHLEAFDRALQVAEYLDCPYIRLFSFFVPEGEADRHRAAVLGRMEQLLKAAAGHPVTLLHENERHIYGDIPRRCYDLLSYFETPQLRLTFDPANFVMCGVRPFTEGYELLADYIAYLHIKDGLLAERRVVPAGEGDGQVVELINALKARGYDGFASLEPHLANAGTFSGFSGPELFTVAAKAFRKVLQQTGAVEG
ncbi:MAG: TIM barrel protein [Anaerolineales bacterium]